MAAVEKRVGRPKLIKPIISDENFGILKSPKNINNILEYETNNIDQFNGYLKYLHDNKKNKQLVMKFDEQNIILYAEDQFNKISMNINCMYSSYYYCGKSICLYSETAIINSILNKKHNHKLIFEIKNDNISTLIITIIDNITLKSSNYTINLNIYNDNIFNIYETKQLSIISVLFSIKELKGLIDSIKKINSNILQFEKNGKNDLILKSRKDNIFFETSINNEQNSVISNINDSIFMSSIEINKLSALAKSNISNNIRLHCYKDSRFCIEFLNLQNKQEIYLLVE